MAHEHVAIEVYPTLAIVDATFLLRAHNAGSCNPATGNGVAWLSFLVYQCSNDRFEPLNLRSA